MCNIEIERVKGFITLNIDSKPKRIKEKEAEKIFNYLERILYSEEPFYDDLILENKRLEKENKELRVKLERRNKAMNILCKIKEDFRDRISFLRNKNINILLNEKDDGFEIKVKNDFEKTITENSLFCEVEKLQKILKEIDQEV